MVLAFEIEIQHVFRLFKVGSVVKKQNNFNNSFKWSKNINMIHDFLTQLTFSKHNQSFTFYTTTDIS